MPLQQILPTWTAWNNANFTSPTALTDLRTGQPFAAGGLNLGDYFDATEQEANTASYTTNGLLHAGRYRYVRVSSAATAGNVAVGKVGYLQPGTFVQSVQVLTQGTGQTVGTYVVTGSGGGATVQATIQVVVNSATSITVTLLTPGSGYTSAPTFTLATGGTPGTVAAQLNTTVNNVTSFDNALAVGIRPVVFLNTITPGNYGFIQELGVATVLGKATSFTGSAAIGVVINAITAGVVDVPTLTTTYVPTTIGLAIDLPVVSSLFKVLLNGPVVQD
jgi:hypothetical protein